MQNSWKNTQGEKNAPQKRDEALEEHKDKVRLNRLFDRLEGRTPAFFSRFLAFMRRPVMLVIRIPLGILLVLGGIFSILPGLGIWMLPLGLLLLALDIPFLRGPLNSVMVRLERWWQTRLRR